MVRTPGRRSGLDLVFSGNETGLKRIDSAVETLSQGDFGNHAGTHLRTIPMLIALAMALLLVLSVVRHIVEPACPGCAAKRWKCEGEMLTCTRCGWSSDLAPQQISAAELPAPHIAGGQYAGAQY